MSSRTARIGLLRPLAAAAATLSIFAVSGLSAATLAQPEPTALEKLAANYIQFREDVAAIEARGIKNPEATREAHKLLAAHDPAALANGWVAYAALVAADSPEFIDALRDEMKNRRKRDAFLKGLRADPYFITKRPEARAAVRAVLEMSANDMAKINALGESFKANAYSMQKTAWGKKKIAEPSARLAAAHAFAKSRPAAVTPTLASVTNDDVTTPGLTGAALAWSPSWGGGEADVAGKPNPRAEAVIDRILNLAARYAVGDTNPQLVAAYAKNPKAEQCLEMRQLVLDQCMAATRAPYEEAFCLGQHGLEDVASCLGAVAPGSS